MSLDFVFQFFRLNLYTKSYKVRQREIYDTNFNEL